MDQKRKVVQPICHTNNNNERTINTLFLLSFPRSLNSTLSFFFLLFFFFFLPSKALPNPVNRPSFVSIGGSAKQYNKQPTNQTQWQETWTPSRSALCVVLVAFFSFCFVSCCPAAPSTCNTYMFMRFFLGGGGLFLLLVSPPPTPPPPSPPPPPPPPYLSPVVLVWFGLV